MDGKELYKALISNKDRYEVYELGCGMVKYSKVINGYWKLRYLLNTNTETAYEIVTANLRLGTFTTDDIDFDSVKYLEYASNASNLSAFYPVMISSFKNGIAEISWTLHPDGMYFMDEDGFGMEPCSEETISAYIDTGCNVLVKFQEFRNREQKEELYNQALANLKSRRADG